ncbi:MAG: PAS domain S-box protein [Desulfobacteraceae bacterium]|nr:PAS domain S-box protein [Desulfobacteraceae bacterium]
MERAVTIPIKIAEDDHSDPLFNHRPNFSNLGEIFSAPMIQTLYDRITELEGEKKKNNQVYQELRDLQQRYHTLIENIPDMVFALDEMGTFLTVNKASAFNGYTPEELVGRPFLEFVHPEDRDYAVGTYLEAVAARQNRSQTIQFRIITKLGEVRWLEVNCSMQFSTDGRFIVHEGVSRDVTEIVQRQQELIKEQAILEERVRIRTQELTKTNTQLQQQIDERLAVEKELRQRETALELEKANLKEANTALKVLLKRREMDKHALEEQVLYNVKKLVLPYLSKMKKEISDEKQKVYLGILESNLVDITCGFSRRLSFEFYGLSTSEIKVANFIRQGKKTKEIAEVLGLSSRTVEAFRQSIRQKLRLQNKKVNLRTFLMSIQ